MPDTRNPREVVDIGKFQPYDHPQYGAGAVREITYLDGTIERRFFHHGTQKEGEGAPDSGYLVDTKVDPKLRAAWDQARPSEPAASRDPNSPDNKNAAELQRQREKNAALPAGQDPAYETDEERRTRAAATIKQQGADAAAAETRERQRKIDEQNAATAAAASRRADSAEARAVAEANKVGAKIEDLTINGQHYTKITKTSPDGKTTAIEHYGPDGAKIEALPRETGKTAFAGEPAGAPEFTTAPGQITAGLRTYSSWLAGQVKLWKDSAGKQGVDPDEATRLMNQRVDLAENAIKEGQNLTSTQSGVRGQNITQRGQSLTETAGRRSTAESIYNANEKQYGDMLAHLPVSAAGTYVNAKNEGLQAAYDYVNKFGGLRESPEIGTTEFPALDQTRRAGMAGIQTAAAGGPVLFAGGPRAAQGAADATAAAQAAQANAQPAPAAMPSPLLAPPPPVAGPMAAPAAPAVPPPSPSQAPVATNPITGAPITMPATVMGQDATPPPEPSFVFEPGQRGIPQVPAQNQTPIEMPQGIDLSTPLQDPGTGPVGMAPTPRFIQEARYGEGNFFDPHKAGADLAARLGIDPEIMRLAAESYYG